MDHPQVEPVPRSASRRPAPAGLGLALGGEVDVGPAGEQVLGVPGGLAVANQDQVRHTFERSQRPTRRRSAPFDQALSGRTHRTSRRAGHDVELEARGHLRRHPLGAHERVGVAFDVDDVDRVGVLVPHDRDHVTLRHCSSRSDGGALAPEGASAPPHPPGGGRVRLGIGFPSAAHCDRRFGPWSGPARIHLG